MMRVYRPQDAVVIAVSCDYGGDGGGEDDDKVVMQSAALLASLTTANTNY